MPTAPRTFRLVPQKQQAKQWASRRAPRRAVYNTKEWRALRREVFWRDNYLCQACLRRGYQTPVAEHANRKRGEMQGHCDHIVPAVTEDDVLCDMSNLETLCQPCHNAKTAREEGAFGR